MKAILIRHGEPNYSNVSKWGKIGLGFELGELSEAGVQQATSRADDPSLQDADLIVASPYTRALQTAAIISRITQIPLTVETELHEWFPDKEFKYDYEVMKAGDVFIENKGERVSDYRYEELKEIRQRVLTVLKKYKKHQKVIFVCHGFVMCSMLNEIVNIDFCETKTFEIE